MTFLLLILLLHIRLADSLSFLTEPNDVSVSINLPAEFVCYVLHDSSIVLSWRHKTQIFACTPECPPIDGYSFSTVPLSGGTYTTMGIDSVGFEDEGEVSCNANDLANLVNISTTATLNVSDVLDFIQVPVGVSEKVGDNAAFHCIANKEGGTFVWKRSGLTIPDNPRYSYSDTSTNSTLTITDLTAVDMREFVCQITLSSDVIASPPAQLALSDYVPPSVLQNYFYQVNLLIGPKTVTCPAEGYPLPTDVTWTKAGLAIPTARTEGPYSTSGVLQFDTSTESEPALYSCLASNGLESANGTVTIGVTGLVGVLTRWYVIMALCVACVAIVCVTGAFLLSVVCCWVDKRKENRFRKRYDKRIQQVKSRRAERARAMIDRSERTKRTEMSAINHQVRATTQAEYTNRHTTQFTESVTNKDGSMTYSRSQERVQVGLRGTTRPNTVTEAVTSPGMRERPPTHLRLPRQAN